MSRRTASAVLSVTLLLAGCGGGTTMSGSSAPSTPGHGSSSTAHAGSGTSAPPSGSVSAAAHNEQDVAFSRDMIVHHASAIAMAEVAERRASSAEVKDLAQRIERAQGPEIETMSSWLRSWGQSVPDLKAALTGGHGAPSGGHGGMDLAELRELSGLSTRPSIGSSSR